MLISGFALPEAVWIATVARPIQRWNRLRVTWMSWMRR